MEEIEVAITDLKSKKIEGTDGIQGELMKNLAAKRKNILAQILHEDIEWRGMAKWLHRRSNPN